MMDDSKVTIKVDKEVHKELSVIKAKMAAKTLSEAVIKLIKVYNGK